MFGNDYGLMMLAVEYESYCARHVSQSTIY